MGLPMSTFWRFTSGFSGKAVVARAYRLRPLMTLCMDRLQGAIEFLRESGTR
jgi:hypothetical protein